MRAGGGIFFFCFLRAPDADHVVGLGEGITDHAAAGWVLAAPVEHFILELDRHLIVTMLPCKWIRVDKCEIVFKWRSGEHNAATADRRYEKKSKR